jgi:hypothetical protein
MVKMARLVSISGPRVSVVRVRHCSMKEDIQCQTKGSNLSYTLYLGTSPLTIRCARPSTTAVLPTPGSPINTGLFFVLRERILTTLRISSSLPITGSSFEACSTRSLPYFFRAWKLVSPVAFSTFLENPLTVSSSFFTL